MKPMKTLWLAAVHWVNQVRTLPQRIEPEFRSAAPARVFPHCFTRLIFPEVSHRRRGVAATAGGFGSRIHRTTSNAKPFKYSVSGIMGMTG